MKRTRLRPLPSERITIPHAVTWASTVGLAGTALLASKVANIFSHPLMLWNLIVELWSCFINLWAEGLMFQLVWQGCCRRTCWRLGWQLPIWFCMPSSTLLWSRSTQSIHGLGLSLVPFHHFLGNMSFIFLMPFNKKSFSLNF